MSDSLIRSKLYEIINNEAPVEVLLPEWEQGIINLLGQPVEKKNSRLVDNLLKEVRTNYYEEMRKFSFRITLALEEKEIVNEDSRKTSYQTNFSKFVKYQKSFRKRYFLSHSLIRSIINIIFNNLPHVLFDLKHYRSKNILTITEVSSKINQDIKRIGLVITKNYYHKIVKSMIKKINLKFTKKEQLKHLLRCATSVFVQSILNIMTHTINNLINSMETATNYPWIKLDLVFEENRLFIKPSFVEIYSMFHNIINDIAKLAQDLIPLEHWMKLEADDYIKIELPTWFLDDSHARLQSVLESTFHLLKQYCENVDAQFAEVRTEFEMRKMYEPSLENFHILCARVETLNEYLSQAKAMVMNVYFDVGILVQSQASVILQKCISKAVNSLVKKLVTYHQDFTQTICLEFESLESRALNIPNDTKSLFDLCEYISRASKIVMKNLEEKIRNSLDMLTSLLQVATLTQEHLELNSKSVNWLWSIEQVFIQSNSLCESMKSVLEDELQKRINTLNQSVDQIIPEMIILDDMDDSTRVHEYLEYLAVVVKKVVTLEKEITWINFEEKLFKFPETTFPKVAEVKEIIEPFHSLVHLVYRWQRNHAVWLNGPFEYLDAIVVERKTSYYFEELTKINNIFKLKIKSEMILTKAYKFSGIVDDPDPMQHPAPLKLCWQALRSLSNFQRYVPLVICMCNRSLTKRHWDEMSEIAGFDLIPNAGTTLGKFIDLNLFDDLHKYQVISVSANKELALRNQLMSMMEEWNSMDFTISQDTSFVHYNQIDALLEQQFLKIREMKCSNFVIPIETEVDEFNESLQCLRNILNKWSYLQQEVNSVKMLFSNKAIILILEKEKVSYTLVRNILKEVEKCIILTPTFQRLVGTSELFEKLQKAEYEMKNVMKNIFIYFDKSKFLFPRLFFLSNKEIMNMFNVGIQTFFQGFVDKCFHGVQKLVIDDEFNIYAAIGELGEKILLQDKISTSVGLKNAESAFNWLVLLEKELFHNIKQEIIKLYILYKNSNNVNILLDSVKCLPGIVVNCVWKIMWTVEMEYCFSVTSKIDKLRSYYNTQLHLKITMINRLRNNISKRDRSILMTLITNHIHEENVSEHLINEKIDEEKDFRWKSQLRYYFDDKNVKVSILDTSVMYNYEYYGLQQPIVITPLTERCYHTLMIAYNHNISASVIGTAGTGKVETIKSLALAFGVLFRMFNYDDNLDYQFIRNIFIGFILCGPWICFKNFGNIKPEFSFIIGQYISRINQSKVTNSKYIYMDGTSLKLNTSGFFITTMTPACVQKLNLLDETKRNFRMVSMIKPDLQKIIEVRLLAAGFSEYKKLTLKLMLIYNYFNKMVINNISNHGFVVQMIMQIINTIINQKPCVPFENENVLLLRSIVDICMPKLHERDIIIFQDFIQDAFPGVILPLPNYTQLLTIVENICIEKHLLFHDILKLKIVQLFEMIHLRNAIIVVGDPFGGKTSALRILADAFSSLPQTNVKLKANKIKDQVKMHVINPNAITFERLYAYCDKDMPTKSWIDGIFAKISRTFIEDNTSSWKWFLFDGNMQNAWIESLQTFLTDGTLFLPSGERLLLPKRTSIFFETSNLQDSSPSIVSRCGVVYIETANWMVYVIPEIQRFYRDYEDLILPLFKWTVNSCLTFLREMGSKIIDTQETHLIISTWKLFKMFLDDAFEVNLNEKEKKKDNITAWCQASVVMATVWGLGGLLDAQSQIFFDAFCVALWTGSNEKFPRPNEVKIFDNFQLNEESLRDHYYIFKGTGNWKYFGDLLKGETIVETPLKFEKYFVPTIDGVKYTMLLRHHVKHRQPFILWSTASSSKTICLKYIFANKLEGLECTTNYYHLTPSMTVNAVQKLFLSKMIKIKSNHYEFPKKFCINFIDDLNLIIDEINIVPTLELIRQHFDHHFWYDIKKSEKIYLHRTIFSSALTLTGKDVKICPRFLRHFNIYAVHPPSKDNMCRIFTQILLTNLKRNLFTTDVLASVTSIVNATIDIYNSIIHSLRPVPSKFQYHFNLRDVVRVIEGCGLIHKESVESKVTFVRLWTHEIFRVFGDKIFDTKDINWLFMKIKDIVKSNFKDSFESVFDNLPKNGNDELTVESFKSLFFGDFMEINKDTENSRRYEEINSLSTLKNKILFYVNEHNSNSARKINIILTNYLVEHLVKICRILTISGGNLLMICCHGSGRQTLIKLSSYIQGQRFFEPSISPTYNLLTWKNDLKNVLQICGASENNITFFCRDWQMNDDHLQNISSLLKFGQIPQLFSDEEWQIIIRKVRLSAQGGDRNMEMSINDVMEYFICKCKQKIHFVLCCNPLEENKLKSILYKYPDILSCCYVDSWERWPDDALQQVALSCVKNVKLSEDMKNTSAEACKYFYNYMIKMCEHKEINNIRQYIPVPATFIRMIDLYVKFVIKNQEKLTTARNEYLHGLKKLESAALRVTEMKMKLTTLRQQLEISAQETEATRKEIEQDNLSIESATVLVKADEEVANKKAEIAAILKTECEADLAVAIPILEDAVAALNTLKPTDITLVKAMKNPPDTVKLVMAAVCVMLDVPPDRIIDPVTGKKIIDYWGPSKRVLGDMNFLQNLKDYDKDNISSSVMNTIKKIYMTDATFHPRIVAKASSAAEGLCKWVRAMVSYDEVAKVVAPKKEKLAAAKEECDMVEAYLNEKRKTLADLNRKMSILKETLKITLSKKQKLEVEVASCTAKLGQSENLIMSLFSEKERWMRSANNLSKDLDNIVGNMIISSGIIIYLTTFDLNKRENIINDWCEIIRKMNIPLSENYNIVQVLGSEIKINSWCLCGLPKNSYSLQNAIILENSSLWAYLLLDPQKLATQWIKNMEKKHNGLNNVKLLDDNYVSVIRSSMELGIPVLIENVDSEMIQSLIPIVSQYYYMSESNSRIMSIDFGYSTIQFDLNFRLYITSNLQVSNEIIVDTFNKVTLIDFSLYEEALQDRLLDIIISRENPTLHNKFENVVIQSAANKKVAKEEERKILQILSASGENILDDEGTIVTLNISKNTFVETILAEKAFESTKNEMKVSYDKYRSFVEYCVNLYSLINSLSNLNYMYRFALSWFIVLYTKSIETSNRSPDFQKRICYLKFSLTQNLHASVRRSLYEEHKIVYSFLLCTKKLVDSKQTTNYEIDLFINIDKLTKFDKSNNSASTWLSEKLWQQICYISKTLAIFQNLPDSLELNAPMWRSYYESLEAQNYELPPPWNEDLTIFQKLIIVRILRPDKIISEIIKFIDATLGNTSDFGLQSNLAESYMESTCLTPIIFILPCYSSPSNSVYSHAREIGCSSQIIHIFVGQAFSVEEGESLIKKARKKGNWVFVHNCHLSTSWMQNLDKICDGFEASDTNLEFRLWISCCSTLKFPSNVLQNGIKLAHDNPIELKQYLSRTYYSEPLKNQLFFYTCSNKSKAFSKLLYSLCFFHAVISERQTFGHQGWNINYDFGEFDFWSSWNLLHRLVKNDETVPLSMLFYLFGECIYGGKIMDIIDAKSLKTLLATYCNSTLISERDYSFLWNESSAEYVIPRRSEYCDCIEFINKFLPLYSPAKVFGFNEAAGIIRNNVKLKNFTHFLSLIENTSFVNGIEDESQIQTLIQNISDRLPNSFNIDQIRKKYIFDYYNPLNNILCGEIERYNKIIEIIRKSMEELKCFYEGNNADYVKAEELTRQLYIGKVPLTWKINTLCYTERTLPAFIIELCERLQFIQDWVDKGHPRMFWLRALTSSSTLFFAIKLTFSRSKNISVNEVEFDYEVIRSSTTEENIDGNEVIVYGLYLSGAAWNEDCWALGESLPKVIFQSMPKIRFKSIVKQNNDYSNKNKIYKCPLYVSSIGRNINFSKFENCFNYICIVNLFTEIDPQYWVRTGTALYCDIE